MDYIIKNTTALIGGSLKSSIDVGVKDGIIAKIGNLNSQEKSIDGTGLILSPGFIDIHIHGNNGFSSMNGLDDILGMAKMLPKYGVTAFLPTSISTPFEDHRKFIDSVIIAMEQEAGSVIIGCNMESPFLSVEKKGAHLAEYILSTQMWNDDWESLIKTGVVKLISIAVQNDDSLKLIERCTQLGAAVSLAHTTADYNISKQAFGAGANHVTHLFNAMNSLHHREPSLVGAALDSKGVTVELIADTVHLHPAILRLVSRIKNPNEITLITDSMMAAGLSDGEYNLGPLHTIVKNGVARIENGALAGSTLTMDKAVKNMINCKAASLQDALTMATATPAKVIGEGTRGVLEVGKRADLILIDEDINIKKVIIGGKLHE